MHDYFRLHDFKFRAPLKSLKTFLCCIDLLDRRKQHSNILTKSESLLFRKESIFGTNILIPRLPLNPNLSLPILQNLNKNVWKVVLMAPLWSWLDSDYWLILHGRLSWVFLRCLVQLHARIFRGDRICTELPYLHLTGSERCI